MKAVVTKANSAVGSQIVLTLPSGRSTVLHIWAPSDLDGSERRTAAQISWPSNGGTSVEDVEAFIKALALAVKAARAMDAKHGVRRRRVK